MPELISAQTKASNRAFKFVFCMRLFVAIDFPEEIREGLTRVCHGLPNARWTDKEQLHLTLRFLGEVDREIFLDIREALHGVKAPPVEMSLFGIGRFMRAGSAQILWAGVKSEDDLTGLHKRVDQCVVDAGLPPEKRGFQPHVTIARLGRIDPKRLEEYLLEFADYQSHAFSVSDFKLYSSRLYPDGAVHTVEEAYELHE